jgi:hypothetical protein
MPGPGPVGSTLLPAHACVHGLGMRLPADAHADVCRTQSVASVSTHLGRRSRPRQVSHALDGLLVT